MRGSLTSRIGNISDALRDVRVIVHALSLSLLEDDHGISEQSFVKLKQLLEAIGCVHVGKVYAIDGRFYISREEV